MQQAALLDGLPLYARTFGQDGLPAAEVDVGGREIVEALVSTAVVVMLDEGLDLRLQLAGQVVVLEQDAVLQRLVPALDLALGLRMAGRAADVLYLLADEPVGQVAGDVARPLSGSSRGL